MNDQLINIKFVEEVEKHEVLYNYNLPGYSRKDLTEKAWQEVAANVNMTATKCKEKWRNLRTVFTRKMKIQQSGSRRKKKAYYLADAMQFSVPFIKTLVPSLTENMCEIPQLETADEIVENVETSDDDTELQLDPLQVPSLKPERPIPSQQGNRSQEQSSSSRNKKNLTLKNKSAKETDTCLAEYCEAKKARLELETTSSATISHISERKEALKMFLLSLMPEVEHFNNDQIKLFKRMVFRVIDDISSQS